jgi:hypothetical protein
MVKIQMKRLLALFCGLIFFIACSKSKIGKNILKEDDMVKLLVDMQLTDAVLDYQYHPDSFMMQAKSRYEYVFKKHKIDSATFAQSLNYYTTQDLKLPVIYDKVLAELKLMKKPELRPLYVDRWESVKMDTSSLDSAQKVGWSKYLESFKKTKVDSLIFINSLSYDNDKYDVAYGIYNFKVDSIKDAYSLPKKVKKVEENKENSTIKDSLKVSDIKPEGKKDTLITDTPRKVFPRKSISVKGSTNTSKIKNDLSN